MSNTATETALDIMQNIPTEDAQNSVNQWDSLDIGNSERSKKERLEISKAQYPRLTAMGRFAEVPNAASEAGKIGGTKSVQTRRKRRLLRDAAQAILSADVSNLPFPEMEDLRIALQALGVEDITGADALLLAQYIRAAKGDTEAFRAIRDTAGEKPSVSVDVTASDRPVDAEMLGAMSDAELAALADGQQDAPALPPKQPEMLQ